MRYPRHFEDLVKLRRQGMPAREQAEYLGVIFILLTKEVIRLWRRLVEDLF